MSTMSRSAEMKRYGSNDPLPERRSLRAGPVSAVLEGGDLRYVRVGNADIVRRLYIAIRDRNWGTIPPVYTRYDVQDEGDRFRIDLAAEHVSADVDFAWSGSIEGRGDGTIEYVLSGAPRKRFFRNRIGFCVLHPAELAGVPAVAVTPDGVVERNFPDSISPHQPFLDMLSISHPAGGGVEAAIAFEGDLFEMEDQRNWTDASFKTYSTPLRLPYPVEVGLDDQITQRVTISVSGQLPDSGQGGQAEPLLVSVDPDRASPLPPIGFGAGRKGTISSEDLNRLRALGPAHLWVSLDLGSPGWRASLARAAERAVALDAPLDLSVIAAPDGGWDDLAGVLAAEEIPVGRVFAFPAVDEPVTFPRSDLATHPETIEAARRALEGTGAVIGGGTRAYFTELNRAMDFLPVDQLDAVTWTINPQVHASDNLSVIETLSAQPETVRSARNLVGSRPLVVGPITLQPPYNPNATGPAPEPGPDELPPEVDSRQLSLLGAGWTVGSIHRLAEADADALTYYELYGWRGLIERRSDLTRRNLFPSDPGQLFPLYHVFAAVSEFAGGGVVAVDLSAPFEVEALAMRQDDRFRLLVASFGEEERELSVRLPDLREATIRVLDELTYEEAAADPAFFKLQGEPLPVAGGSATISLAPFAVARIDGHLA